VSTEKNVRVCVVGCGKLITLLGLKGLLNARGVSLAGLCDSDPGRLEVAARRSGVRNLHGDYDGVLRDPGVDAVYIATPPHLHYDMTCRAIAAGKHVLCEKPFTLDLAQALDIERRVPPGLVVMPAHNYVYAPGMQLAQAMVEEGLIGEVKKIENTYDVNIRLWNAYTKYYFSDENAGVLGDDFPHLVYTTMLFGGGIRDVQRVVAEKERRDVYDRVSVTGTTEHGCAFELRATWHSPAVRWKMRIIGTTGEVRVSLLSGWKAEAFDHAGRLIERRGKGNLLSLVSGAFRIYQSEYEDFARAIMDGRPPLVSLADGVATARVIDAVRKWTRGNAHRPLVLVREASYERMDDCVEEIFARLALDLRGKRVLLKPNILGAWPVEKAATTHPAVVTAVARAVEKRGGTVHVGDNPGTGSYGSGHAGGDVSGIREASGARWVDLGKESTSVAVDSRFFDSLLVSRAVIDADFVINLPKLKTHALTVLTGAIKNMFGILVGRQKATIHSLCPDPRDFCEALVDVYRTRLPGLTIMDAVIAMEGNGPSGGRPRLIGRIVASEDGVAVDAVCATLVGVDPLSLGTLKAAAARRLGQTELARMRIDGDITPVEGFRLPIRAASSTLFGRITNLFMPRVEALPRFDLDKALCTKCEECRKHCPRAAIQMTPWPRIDRDRCIGCYCCFELCPQNALSINGSRIIPRLLSRL
jgi:uncharacterized protein (DUF362 family)/NAD-dependent dihydropyrimidine dehydrogenase PreA subunit